MDGALILSIASLIVEIADEQNLILRSFRVNKTLNLFMYNIEKWQNILKMFCGVNTARF